jgi:UDP-N-acetylmuramoylalanine--D-glutamate ligase
MTRRVAVVGYGSAGHALVNLLKRTGRIAVVYDERSGESGQVIHEFSAEMAAEHDLVIHSLAFAPQHPWLQLAREAGCKVISEIEFAQHLRSGPTILVVGTNGKTTLQEFITFALKRMGHGAVAVGPGKSPLSRLVVHPELDGMTAVCEFTPERARHLQEFRFDALFWTNFHEDHHEHVEDRLHAFNAYAHLMELSPAAQLYVGDSVVAAAAQLGYNLPERVQTLRPQDYADWELTEPSAFATVVHRPALALFRRYWLEKGYSDSLLRSAAEHFEVRAHRLHPVTWVGEVCFWNDAKSANFAATAAAMNNFSEPLVWIGGGVYRGGDLERFVDGFSAGLHGAVLLGEAGKLLLPILTARGIRCVYCEHLKQAVETAFQMTQGRAPVVYSPGFVAGAVYSSSIERGICFENAVLGLKHQVAAPNSPDH